MGAQVVSTQVARRCQAQYSVYALVVRAQPIFGHCQSRQHTAQGVARALSSVHHAWLCIVMTSANTPQVALPATTHVHASKVCLITSRHLVATVSSAMKKTLGWSATSLTNAPRTLSSVEAMVSRGSERHHRHYKATKQQEAASKPGKSARRAGVPCCATA